MAQDKNKNPSPKTTLPVKSGESQKTWSLDVKLTAIGLAITILLVVGGWIYNIAVLKTEVDLLNKHIEGQNGHLETIINLKIRAKNDVDIIEKNKTTAFALEEDIKSIRDRAHSLFSTQRDLEQTVAALQDAGIAEEATRYVTKKVAKLETSIYQDIEKIRADIGEIQKGNISYRLKITNAFTARASKKYEKYADTIPLGSSTNRICFLSRVKFEDLDSENEDGICEVTIDENKDWVLKAKLKKNSDGKAYCEARCFEW